MTYLLGVHDDGPEHGAKRVVVTNKTSICSWYSVVTFVSICCVVGHTRRCWPRANGCTLYRHVQMGANCTDMCTVCTEWRMRWSPECGTFLLAFPVFEKALGSRIWWNLLNFANRTTTESLVPCAPVSCTYVCMYVCMYVCSPLCHSNCNTDVILILLIGCRLLKIGADKYSTSGFEGVSPTSVYKGVSPTSRIKIVSPTSNFKVVSPTSDFKVVSPTSGFKIVGPTSDFKILSPTYSFKIVSPTSSFKIMSPTCSFITVSPNPLFRNVSPTCSFKSVNPFRKCKKVFCVKPLPRFYYISFWGPSP
jgi:hypothetical protein